MAISGHVLLCASLMLGADACSGDASCTATAAGQERPRPEAPEVVLEAIAAGTCGKETRHCTLSSDDKPQSYVPVAPAKLITSVYVSEAVFKKLRQTDRGPAIEFFLDGKAIKAVDVDRSPPWRSTSRGREMLPRHGVPCPVPGKHCIQARYLLDNQWSQVSKPLCFNVRLPQPPEIVSVSPSAALVSEPLPRGDILTVADRQLRLKLANVRPGVDRVLLYLDEQLLESAALPVGSDSTVAVVPSNPPGVYRLTARVVPAQCGFHLASRPSKPVLIRYQPTAGYSADMSRRARPVQECAPSGRDPDSHRGKTEAPGHVQRPTVRVSPEVAGVWAAEARARAKSAAQMAEEARRLAAARGKAARRTDLDAWVAAKAEAKARARAETDAEAAAEARRHAKAKAAEHAEAAADAQAAAAAEAVATAQAKAAAEAHAEAKAAVGIDPSAVAQAGAAAKAAAAGQAAGALQTAKEVHVAAIQRANALEKAAADAQANVRVLGAAAAKSSVAAEAAVKAGAVAAVRSATAAQAAADKEALRAARTHAETRQRQYAQAVAEGKAAAEARDAAAKRAAEAAEADAVAKAAVATNAVSAAQIDVAVKALAADRAADEARAARESRKKAVRQAETLKKAAADASAKAAGLAAVAESSASSLDAAIQDHADAKAEADEAARAADAAQREAFLRADVAAKAQAEARAAELVERAAIAHANAIARAKLAPRARRATRGPATIQHTAQALAEALRALEQAQAETAAAVEALAGPESVDDRGRKPGPKTRRREPDAFRSIPVPKRIPRADGDDPASAPGHDEDGQQKYAVEHRFFSPAHFPLPGYGAGARPAEEEGALIYEGMRFSANYDGRYEVSFVVGTPAVPTTLRLQFLVKACGRDGQSRWHTVTLPPIEIPADKDGQAKETRGAWEVTHDGYSAALEFAEKCQILEVRRLGTARFGFGTSF